MFRDLTRSLVEGVHYTSLVRQASDCVSPAWPSQTSGIRSAARAGGRAPLAEPVLSEVSRRTEASDASRSASPAVGRCGSRRSRR
ncbi:hypothetical protein DSL92_07405 [Billgrantia gudaonensis]|uniref:Uncharacterized protein n=1 Tax=Billgrantia gudaonensis TaxID=376427 RepID=A0A3S0QFP9_9GAMM|nr:hypothetical protein DSL92_07405 [Halomonas gudaonensis]